VSRSCQFCGADVVGRSNKRFCSKRCRQKSHYIPTPKGQRYAGLLKHGAALSTGETPEYRSWRGMRDRCNCRSHSEFHRYGGRGIKVCARWDDFLAFLVDMGKRPTSTHSLDRIDTDGNYEPSNCRWATPSEQARNKRTSIVLTHNGVTLHVLDWSRRLGLAMSTIRMRLRKTRDAALVLRPSRQPRSET
jgi:hypothetical protein